MENVRLIDAHVHLNWFAEPGAVAAQAASNGVGLFCCTVTPREYEEALRVVGSETNVRVGVGLHPWWVASGQETRAMLDAAAKAARVSDWVGEIGLDFGPKHIDTAASQLECFRTLCEACADGRGPGGTKTLSIHSVRSASAVLDVLEETGAASSCRCVLHWFSGTSEELARARKMGCWFSVGEMSLKTRRGREYARQIPADRLLLETDLPERNGHDGDAAEITGSLERAARVIRELRPGWDPSAQAKFFDEAFYQAL